MFAELLGVGDVAARVSACCTCACVCLQARLCAAGTRKLVRQLRCSTVEASVRDESHFWLPLCDSLAHRDPFHLYTRSSFHRLPSVTVYEAARRYVGLVSSRVWVRFQSGGRCTDRVEIIARACVLGESDVFCVERKRSEYRACGLTGRSPPCDSARLRPTYNAVTSLPLRQWNGPSLGPTFRSALAVFSSIRTAGFFSTALSSFQTRRECRTFALEIQTLPRR